MVVDNSCPSFAEPLTTSQNSPDGAQEGSMTTLEIALAITAIAVLVGVL
jgi:hypothetical protein